ncbi:MAG: XisI protein [Saprospiraceae bacterium]|nr:XisI protein [Saprospiraceae bacterium]MCF8251732.1 XisI protein [Saprospiraceae bacterium]MCF8281114.1 XisI protein [Bacteroidales bacterium]MCF8311786.1 XisI protein [Saprospiraceae bacterium]MCF8441764.1 XisI protein [Saprospiraceae bacterium]
MHFHLKPDGKIWVETNNTEIQVAKELEKKGVPKTDIVLGFHPESVRHLTDYAVV